MLASAHSALHCVNVFAGVIAAIAIPIAVCAMSAIAVAFWVHQRHRNKVTEQVLLGGGNGALPLLEPQPTPHRAAPYRDLYL